MEDAHVQRAGIEVQLALELVGDDGGSERVIGLLLEEQPQVESL